MVETQGHRLTQAVGYGGGPRTTRFGGAGDVCATPGCDTVLRRSNQWDICAKCESAHEPRQARKPEREDPTQGQTPAGQEERTASRPASATLPPAANPTKQALLERLKAASGRTIGRDELMTTLNVSGQRIGGLMRGLRGDGEPVEIVYKGAVPGYRYITEAPPDDDACPASSGSPSTPGEQPASERAADPEPSPTGPPPFAGIDTDLDAVVAAIRLIEEHVSRGNERRAAACVAAWFEAEDR